MRPVVKWAGGKSRLVEKIAEALGEPCEGTFYEPFLGSASVYLHLRAVGWVKRAVLSDANERLISMHRAIRDDVQGVLNALDTLPKEDWRDRYYEVREDYNELERGTLIQAARFLWLNRAGFNGLYRENRSGKFNVPVGRYAKLSFPKPDHFKKVSELLQDAELISADFRDVVDAAGERDQVYCDPPYVPLSTTANFTGYHRSPFGPEEQIALATAARKVAFRGARVVLSNHDLPVVRNELYPQRAGFVHVSRPRVARAISRSSASRKRVGEVIAAIGPLEALG